MAIATLSLAEEHIAKFDDAKPAKEILIDTDEQKIVHFYLKSGQSVEPHQANARVNLTVMRGRGSFLIGDEAHQELKCGESVYYEVQQMHGFMALEDLVVQAIIVKM